MIALNWLQSSPHSFQLFQALRILEMEGVDVGSQVRISHIPHLWHTSSDLAAVNAGSDGRITIESYVYGLLSPSGPLPLRLTEDAIRQARSARGPLGDFLSMLGESQALAFYSAWRVGRLELAILPGESGQKAALRSLTSGIEDPMLALCMLPQWRNAARGCEGLRATVQTLTGFNVSIEQLIGEWLEIPLQLRSRLGGCRLNVDATLGSRQWARHCRIRLTLHVGRWHEFQDYIPSRGSGFRSLQRVLSFYFSSGLLWTLDIIIPSVEVLGSRLGRLGRLGEDSWLGIPASRHALVRFGPQVAL